MGLGLEQWDLTYWFVYVAATVVMEAWFIGRWIGLPPIKSELASILGNLITGLCCGSGGLIAVGLHSTFVGSQLNPNPFMNAVVLLTGFAIPSALVEALVWKLFARGASAASDGRIVGGTLLAHLLGIPLALLILLLPSRPYVGLERITARSRLRFTLVHAMKIYLGEGIEKDNRVPDLDPARLEARLRSDSDLQDGWAALYQPDFERFDMGEMRRKPLEWNRALVGKEFGGDKTNWQWLARSDRGPNAFGLLVDLSGGSVKVARLPSELGY